MSPKIDLSMRRKAEIIQAATEIFCEQGISARMEDIAERAGLSKATAYLYFENKDVLTEAVLSGLFSTSIASFEEVTDRDCDISEKLRLLVDEVVGAYERGKPLAAIILDTLAYSLRHPNSSLPGTLKAYLQRGLKVAEVILAEGVASGELRPIDPEAMAKSLSAGLEGCVLLWVYDPDAIDIREVAHDQLDAMLDGILKQD